MADEAERSLGALALDDALCVLTKTPELLERVTRIDASDGRVCVEFKAPPGIANETTESVTASSGGEKPLTASQRIRRDLPNAIIPGER